jgi:hypothetical protein
MTYRAKAALPYLDSERAVLGLRGQLWTLAAGEGATPDWSTLSVTGPEEVIGRHGVTWYEWTAAVDSQAEPARYL